jgi:hypothetical protein
MGTHPWCQPYKPYFLIKTLPALGRHCKAEEEPTIIAAWQHVSLLGNKILTNLLHAK